MTKSLCALLILSTCFAAGCASNDTADKFAADDCKSLTTLFNDQNLNASANISDLNANLPTTKSKDKLTWPWEKGGTNEDKVSKERAEMRKAHNRKGCAQ